MHRHQVDNRPTSEHLYNRDFNNYKPFRRKAEKRRARERAFRTDDGHYSAPAEDLPTMFHPVRRELLPLKSRWRRIRMIEGVAVVEQRSC